MTVVWSAPLTGTDNDPWPSDRFPTVVATGTSEVDILSNEGRMYMTGIANAAVVATADLAAIEDFDLTGFIRPTSGFTAIHYIFFHAAGVLRSGTTVAAGAYGAILDTGSDVVSFRSYGETTDAALGTSASFNFQTNVKARYRLRVVGETASIWVWNDGSTEPDPDVDTPLKTVSLGSSYPSGVFMFRGVGGTGSGDVRHFRIGDLVVDDLVVPPVQYAIPSGDISDGSWVRSDNASPTAKYQMIDENEAADNTTKDADWIQSGVVSVSEDVTEILLEAESMPSVDTGWYALVRARKDAAGGDTVNLHLSLVEGTTVRASTSDGDAGWPKTLTENVVEYQWDIPEAEVATITDTSDLRLRLRAVKG